MVAGRRFRRARWPVGEIYLVTGQRDATCAPWQSEQLAGTLRDAGYHVELVELDGADHYAPIFHEVRDGQFQVGTDAAAGERTIDAVLDAIAASRSGAADQ